MLRVMKARLVIVRMIVCMPVIMTVAKSMLMAVFVPVLVAAVMFVAVIMPVIVFVFFTHFFTVPSIIFRCSLLTAQLIGEAGTKFHLIFSQRNGNAKL